ncbi:RHS repeat-associated core domain-containing protein [Desulfosediminicola flagellatus]|uniref:RHS repeat-associated core domain-containing protein n=1 Tax=Desulfosediminicola flagellatus TaxID=2569541 RepID=UPI0010AC0429|nr:RHS repeat-associated core domain-containing protein [Desulfosediminicola flagellatus]
MNTKYIPYTKKISLFIPLFLFWILVSGAGSILVASEELSPVPTAVGKPRSVRVAPSMGMLTDSIPIVVSPGRRNMEPKFVMSYNSSGGIGILGLGWQLGLGHVEKWRGEGTPEATPANSFGYSLVGAGGELVDTGNGVYRAKLESAYREFVRKGEGWEMHNGEGMVHRFGSTAESRIGGQRWLLDQVEDAHGNTINYTYENINGAIYPIEVRYTGYAPDYDLGANFVVFDYEMRPDVRSIYSGLVQTGQPLREEMVQRLRSLSVYASGNLVRRYEFDYTQNEMNGLSMLSKVTLVGADDKSRILLRTINYAIRTLGWDDGSVPNDIPVDLVDAAGRDSGSRVIDVNGDNYADIVDGYKGSVYLGNGQGGFTFDQDWSYSLAVADILFIDTQGADGGVRLLDVNSDALPDLFIARHDRREVWLNTGSGWSFDEGWTASLLSLNGPVRFDPEFPGTIENCTPPHCDGIWGEFLGCTPPHCTGTDDDPNCVPPECEGDTSEEGCLPAECDYLPEYSDIGIEPLALVGDKGDSQGVKLADVNGDGRVDILWSMSSTEGLYYLAQRRPISVRAAYLNTGSGWVRHDGLSVALQSFEFVTDSHINGFEIIDINGDGLSDIVRTKDNQNVEERSVFLGTGHGWSKDLDYTSSLIDNGIYSIKYIDTGDGVEPRGQGLMPTDLNDDGLIDYVLANDLETKVFRNIGNGWEEDPILAELFIENNVTFIEDEGTESTGIVFANIDGDGLFDIVKAKDGFFRTIHFSSGMRSGLMVDNTNALGEITKVEWGMSASLDNLNADGIEGLPINMPVVKSLSRDHGRGFIYSTEFDYLGGLFETRQFRGFMQSGERRPSGLEVHSLYHQTEELAGQLRSQIAVDSTNQIREKQSAEYEIISANASVKQIHLVRTEKELIEVGESRKTVVKYSYDGRMNPVSIYKDPEVGIAGDEIITEFTWITNEQSGIWSLPAKTTIFGAENEVLTESIVFYDNQPEGHVIRGLPTQSKDLVDGATYVFRGLSYDRYGNVTTLYDRGGGISKFSYDITSTFRTGAIDPEGREVFTEYDPRFGSKLKSINASGNQTNWYYDAFGRLEKIVEPGDEESFTGTRSYTYSPFGNPASQHYVLSETQSPDNPKTLDTTMFFDSIGMTYRVERMGADGSTIVTMNEFDDEGNPIKTSLPFYKGDVPVFSVITRDELRRPTRIVDPDGYETNMTYLGQRVDLIGRDGNKISTWRNINGKVIRMSRWVDGEEQTTRYTYDANGRMTSIINALGEVTTIAFDLLGRRTRQEDPNAGIYTYRYDGMGRLVAQTGPGGDETSFTYNRAGNLLEKLFEDGSKVKFTYGKPGDANAVGLLTRVEDAAGNAEIRYDVRGNVIQRKREVLNNTFLTGYAYDSLGRLRRVTYPDGFLVNYDYDAASNVKQLTDGEGQLIASGFRYSATGQLLNIEYRNGVKSNFSYSDLTQMNSIQTTTQAGDTLQYSLYSYDPQGNILAIDDLAAGFSQVFEYDDAGRLTFANGGYGERIYEYDAIDNLVRKNNMIFEMDPSHLQRVASVQQLEPKGADSKHAYTIDYDQRGNMTAKNGIRYQYSAENSLIRVFDEKGKFLEENVYDAQGQRVIQWTRKGKTFFIDGIYERGKTHDSRHVYAGSLLVSTIVTPRATVRLVNDIEPVFISCAQPGLGHGLSAFLRRHSLVLGSVGAMGTFVLPWFLIPCTIRRRATKEVIEVGKQARIRPLDTLMILVLIPVFLSVTSVPAGAKSKDQRYFDWSSNSVKRYYYHSNHLGSINVVTDHKGKIVERREYTPYGESVNWTGPNGGPRELLLTFNGHRYDDNTGLYYFGARHYDAELGRFTTADNLIPDPMNPKTHNRYGFAGGNPVRYSDPTGHAWYDIVIGVLVVVAAVVLVGVLVAGAVLTLGATSWTVAIGLGVAAGLITLAIGVIVGASFGIATAVSGGTLEEAGLSFLNGLVLGTVVTAGVLAVIVSMATIAAGGFAIALVSGILIGAAFGAINSTIDHFKNGGGPDNLFWAMFSGIAWGVAFGAVGGAIGSAVSFGFEAGEIVAMVAVAIGWTAIGLAPDVFDTISNTISGHSLGGFIQASLYVGALWVLRGASEGVSFLDNQLGGKNNTGGDVYDTLNNKSVLDTVFGVDYQDYYILQPLAP